MCTRTHRGLRSDSAAPGGGAPKLHLDACALPDLAVERELSPWAPVVGPSLANAPKGGGVYCAAGFNQRPAVRFEDGRGYQLASASALDYTDSLVLVAALSYEAKPNAPGSIIFSRSNGTASTGFPGPTLAGNMTYVAPFGSTNIDPAPGIGMQFCLGERPAVPSTPTATDSIAVVTTDYRSGPLIVVVRVVPSTPPSQTYELRINGKFEKQVVLDSVFTSTGAGEMLRIGHTSQAENAFFGYLGELMFFTSDRTDYLEIETAMLAKWGVPRAN